MLEALIEMRAEVAAVCTLAQSSFNTDHVDLTAIAKRERIPVRYTPDINAQDVGAWIRGHSPDVMFCFGWPRLLRPPLLSIARLGVIGYHPTALPANRGRHPLIWALALGLDQTASTFFFMDEGADSGDILSQEPIRILAQDDAGSLYERISHVAKRQMGSFVPALQSAQYSRSPQDHARANYWRKRGRIDGQIDWRMPARSIHDLVRALGRPYPGAHFVHNGQEIKVWRTEVVPEPRNNLEPGKVLEVAGLTLTIKAGLDAVRLLAIQPMISVDAGEYV